MSFCCLPWNESGRMFQIKCVNCGIVIDPDSTADGTTFQCGRETGLNARATAYCCYCEEKNSEFKNNEKNWRCAVCSRDHNLIQKELKPFAGTIFEERKNMLIARKFGCVGAFDFVCIAHLEMYSLKSEPDPPTANGFTKDLDKLKALFGGEIANLGQNFHEVTSTFEYVNFLKNHLPPSWDIFKKGYQNFVSAKRVQHENAPQSVGSLHGMQADTLQNVQHPNPETIASTSEPAAAPSTQSTASTSDSGQSSTGHSAPTYPKELSHDEYTVEESNDVTNLGSGAHSVVKMGRLGGNVKVAVKILKRNSGDIGRLHKEIELLKTFQGPNVVQLYGWNDADLALVLEYCPLGSLRDVLQSKSGDMKLVSDKLNEWPTRLKFLQGLASALALMHSKDYVHHDLKAENVLVVVHQEEAVAKLTDFGSACSCGQSRALSTLRFTAPELLNQDVFSDSQSVIPTKKSDIFSFAFILLLLVNVAEVLVDTTSGRKSSKFRTEPWDHGNVPNSDQAIVEDIIAGIRPRLPETTGCAWSDFYDLIVMCWSPNPCARPNASFVVEYLKYLQFGASGERTDSAARTRVTTASNTTDKLLGSENLPCRFREKVLKDLKWTGDKLKKHEIVMDGSDRSDDLLRAVLTHVSKSGHRDSKNSTLLGEGAVNEWAIDKITVVEEKERLRSFLFRCSNLARRADVDKGWRGNQIFREAWREMKEGSDPVKFQDELNHREEVMAFLEEHTKLELPKEVLEKVPELKYLRLWTVYHVCKNEDSAMSICQQGFAALAVRDSGFFTQGNYFSPDLEYVVSRYGQDGVAVVLCCDVVVGNVYPVIESPDDPSRSLLGNAPDHRYDAYFAAVEWVDCAYKSETGESVKGPLPCRPKEARQEGRDLRSELVLFETASILPRFVLNIHKKELA